MAQVTQRGNAGIKPLTTPMIQVHPGATILIPHAPYEISYGIGQTHPFLNIKSATLQPKVLQPVPNNHAYSLRPLATITSPESSHISVGRRFDGSIRWPSEASAVFSGLKGFSLKPISFSPSSSTRTLPPKKRILYIELPRDPQGKLEYRKEDTINAIPERYPDGITKLANRTLFTNSFVWEVDPKVYDSVLKNLTTQGIPAVDIDSLASAFNDPSQSPKEITNDADLLSWKKALSDSNILQRFKNASLLQRSLSSLNPSKILTRFSESARDEMAERILSVLNPAVALYQAISEYREWAFSAESRKTMENEGRQVDRDEAERFAQAKMEEPEQRAELQPFKEIFGSVMDVLDLLHSPFAQALVVYYLPHLNYSGLSWVEKTPERRREYFTFWLNLVPDSISKTLKALVDKNQKGQDYRRTLHGRGYENLQGHRNSITAIAESEANNRFWDPDRLGYSMLYLLSRNFAERPRMIQSIIETILNGEKEIPAIDSQNELIELQEKAREFDASIQRYLEAGNSISEERLNRMREDFLLQASEQYREREKITGHPLLDALVRHLGFYWYDNAIPGFHLVTYISSILEIYISTLPNLQTDGMIQQMSNEAITLLETLQMKPQFLQEHPDIAQKSEKMAALIKQREDAAQIQIRSTKAILVDERKQRALKLANSYLDQNRSPFGLKPEDKPEVTEVLILESLGDPIARVHYGPQYLHTHYGDLSFRVEDTEIEVVISLNRNELLTASGRWFPAIPAKLTEDQLAGSDRALYPNLPNFKKSNFTLSEILNKLPGQEITYHTFAGVPQKYTIQKGDFADVAWRVILPTPDGSSFYVAHRIRVGRRALQWDLYVSTETGEIVQARPLFRS
ncbi:MAG: hypothetical protein HY400_01040 [Elusimicrobia bacterium]|nr:hypothetical protein [Elusimicrobiota bacterium]